MKNEIRSMKSSRVRQANKKALGGLSPEGLDHAPSGGATLRLEPNGELRHSDASGVIEVRLHDAAATEVAGRVIDVLVQHLEAGIRVEVVPPPDVVIPLPVVAASGRFP